MTNLAAPGTRNGAPASDISDQLIAPVGDSKQLLDSYRQHLMNTFGTPKRVFTRGDGCYVWDTDGRRYLDLLAGLAVNALGHAHPKVLAAIDGQLATLGHVSNFFATPAQIRLAERLTGIVAGDDEAKVFFGNSGTEANETAFKITRLTGRTKIIAAEGAFHGRTMGALAVTHGQKFRGPFEPLPGNVEFVSYGDLAALEAAVDDQTAAIVLEPIQGENGVVVPPDGYLSGAREIADRNGALLWIDEIQTGMGRTGRWLDSGREGVVADIVTLAKGLGNGFPIGACVATGTAADLLGPGSHGSTFGGNPVAAIAGLAVISVIEEHGLLANAAEMGDRLADGIRATNHPLINDITGRGLLRGIQLVADAAPAVVDAALDAGFVINAARPNVLRIAPPLIVQAGQIDAFTAALPGLLDQAKRAAG
jgi:acetylornithine aminotransferase